MTYLWLKFFQHWHPALGTPSGWLQCPFNMSPTPLFFKHFFFFNFLVLKVTSGSYCIFPAPALELSISPRSFDPFYWRIELRNQDLSATCLIVVLFCISHEDDPIFKMIIGIWNILFNEVAGYSCHFSIFLLECLHFS